jgi:ABC-type nitrate/sulfonate/bicarbonate transport system substrate-binding protein
MGASLPLMHSCKFVDRYEYSYEKNELDAPGRYLYCAGFTFTPLAQSKSLRELRVPYALGGSTSFFWVARRSGSFEKHGIKVLPIFMRGGREAIQALISRDVFMEVQGSSGVLSAWAQGAKDLVVIGATGNKLDLSFLQKLEEERRTKR